MNPFDVFHVLQLCAVLTTFWLGLGFAGAWWQRTRPARAHFILFLAIVGCLMSPLAYYAARQWNLGLMPAPRPRWASEATPGDPEATNQKLTISEHPKQITVGTTLPQSEQPAQTPRARAAIPTKATSVGDREDSPEPQDEITRWTWASLALGIWTALSIALSIRLIFSLRSAARVLSRSSQLSDRTILEAVDSARTYLGVETAPDLRCSAGIESPAIWCWSRRPTLLIPSALLAQARPMAWESLLCHELSHWRRLDHVTSLIGEFALIVFPWHPLVWLARAYLRHLCELACDRWVIAAGHSRYHYAQNLLSLAVQPNSIAVLPALSTRKGLRARIDQVVNGSVSTAWIGRGWSGGMSSIVFLMTLAVALLQSPSASSQQAAPKPAGSSPADSVGNPGSSMGMTARRVETRNVRISWGPSVSPDGRYFCGFDYPFDFYVGEIRTGKMMRIFESGKEDFYGVTSVWSPDSERILLSGNKKVLLYELATRKKEVFLEGTSIFVYDWSSDGESLLATRTPESGGNASLSLISWRTKTIRELEVVEGPRQGFKATFSPDGKKILYATTTSGRSTLHVRNLDGAWRLNYDEFFGRIESPLWSDDGQFVIFKGAQGGSIDLLALRFEQDQFVGFPILIRPDAKNLELLNRVQNGQLAYKLQFEGGLYTLPMDPATAKPVGKLKKIFQGGFEHSWSLDGKKLARIVSPTSGEVYLVIVAADSGQLLKRIFLPNEEAVVRMSQTWTGDSTVLIGAAGGAIGRGFYQVKVDSGEVEPVMPVSLSDLGPFGYFSLGAKNRVTIGGSAKGIHVVDIAEKKTILTVPTVADYNKRFGRPAISADGEWITFQQGGTNIWIASVKDGNARVLFDFKKINHTLNIHSWCPNGKFISAIAFPKGGDNELWMVPVDGGDPFQIPLPPELGEPWYPQWSPDGSKLAIHFFSGEDQYWVTQNYIPLASR